MIVREIYLNKIRGFYDSNLVKILVWIRILINFTDLSFLCRFDWENIEEYNKF